MSRKPVQWFHVRDDRPPLCVTLEAVEEAKRKFEILFGGKGKAPDLHTRSGAPQ